MPKEVEDLQETEETGSPSGLSQELHEGARVEEETETLSGRGCLLNSMNRAE